MTLIKKAISNSLFPVVKIIVALLLTRIILNALGAENFNILKEVMALLSLTWVLQLGLNSYITRQLPHMIETKNREGQVRVVTSVAFFYYLLGAAIIFIGYAYIYLYIDEVNYKYAYAVCIAAYFVSASLSYQKGVMSARQDFELIAKYEICSYLVYAVTMYVVCMYSEDYRYIYAVSVIPIVLPQLAMYVSLKKEKLVAGASFKLPVFLDAVRYSYANVLFTSAALVIMQTSFISIVRALDTTEATAYVLTYQLTTLFSSVVMLMLATLKPEYSKLHDRGDRKKVYSIKLLVSVGLIVVSSIYFFVLNVFANEILQLWVGSDDYQVRSVILFLLSLYTFIYLMLYADYIYLSSIDRHRNFGLIFFIFSLIGSLFIYMGPGEAVYILCVINAIGLASFGCSKLVVSQRLTRREFN